KARQSCSAVLFLREMTGFSGALQPSHWRGPPSPQALSYRLAETGDLRSVFVRRIEPLRETQAGDPILAALQEISGIHELAVPVFAGFLAGDRVIALAGCQCRDLTLTRHFQEVMIDDACGDAFAADQHAVIAQDHEGAAVKVAD